MTEKELRERLAEVVLRAAIAEQIIYLRCSRGLTQKQLAEALDTQPAVVVGWEDHYGRWMSVETLTRIAAYFDVALRVQFASWQEFVECYCNGRPDIPGSFPSGGSPAGAPVSESDA